jgi:hypothetical protein
MGAAARGWSAFQVLYYQAMSAFPFGAQGLVTVYKNEGDDEKVDRPFTREQ